MPMSILARTSHGFTGRSLHEIRRRNFHWINFLPSRSRIPRNAASPRLLLVLLLALLGIVTIGSEMFFMRMARQAGEAQMIVQIGNYFMNTIVGVWDFAAFFPAFFLGAIGVSSEISARTIVHVMSRPVERWVYLLAPLVGPFDFSLALSFHWHHWRARDFIVAARSICSDALAGLCRDVRAHDFL